MIFKLAYLIAYFSLAATFSSLAFASQPVYSLKNLGEHRDAQGAYIKVQVKCNSGFKLRYIHQNLEAETWCVDGNLAECFEERIDAATRACRIDELLEEALPKTDRKPVANSKALKNQAERKALEAELLSIEEKRLEIQMLKLELKKRELTLIKQRDN